MRSLFCLAIFAFSQATCVAQDLDLDFPDFSDTTGLQLNGDATQVGNVLRLSETSAFSGGSVFSTNLIDFSDENSFSTFFQFQIGDSGGIGDGDGAGADGLVFAIQPNANNVGTAGGQIGYGGIPSSIGIEFDTFNNGAGFGDPDGNHVGIDLNGNIVSVATASESERFNNGEIWNAWIEYNGLLDELEVRWSLDDIRPEDSLLSLDIDLFSVIGQDSAFVGFTSATGSGFGNHDLLQWQFSGQLAQVPEPASSSLIAIVSVWLFCRRGKRAL